ncbi:hypothetical protein DFH28DRAFT_934048 [Melampsora americana]|nr:hypothetical protein DFH28DRAFT_934048 [Melampsora americana]
MNFWHINQLQHTQGSINPLPVHVDHCLPALLIRSMVPMIVSGIFLQKGVSFTIQSWIREIRRKREERLNQLQHPPPRVPAPPPPEWVRIAGNNDHKWINEPNINDQGDEVVAPAPHAQQRQYQKYFAKCQDFFSTWGALKDQMLATYLTRQHTTKSWTTQESYHEAKPHGCVCSPEDHHPARQIDLIDILGYESVSMSFCGCQPEVIQLLYQGYVASSPSRPQTAFLVCYVQLYHGLWDKSGLNKTGFVKELSNSPPDALPANLLLKVSNRKLVLSGSLFQTHTKYTAASLGFKTLCYMKHLLHGRQFPAAHNTKASKDHPLDNQYPPIFVKPSNIQKNENAVNSTGDVVDEGGQPFQNVCSNSHKAANDLSNTSIWAHCDDTGLVAASCQHNVPLRIANIYKTGEKPYYPFAVIQSILEDFLGKKFGVLFDIGCHLERHLKCHQENLEFATSVFHAYVYTSGSARFNTIQDTTQTGDFSYLQTSTRMHQFWAISDCTDHYTQVLLENSAQKEAMVDPKVQQEIQKLELGKLLCLEDEHNRAWKTVIQTPEQVIAWARLVEDLQKRIQAQKKKVGSDAMTNDLSGHRGPQKVLAAIKTCAAKTTFPGCASPKHMDFQQLMTIEANDNFWNEGLFTYNDQPWAIDIPTQAERQALDHMRQLQWETCRLMQWMTAEFQKLQYLLLLIGRTHPAAGQSPATQAQLAAFLGHPRLASLSLEVWKVVVKVIIHKNFNNHCELYQYWNTDILEVFQMLTSSQAGNEALSRTWHYQMAQVNYLKYHEHASMIEGDFDGVIAAVLAFYNIAPELDNDNMALRRLEENVPEEPEQDQAAQDMDFMEVELE